MPGVRSGDDQGIIPLIILTRALTTGRTLRSDVPRGELAPDELIAFWLMT